MSKDFLVSTLHRPDLGSKEKLLAVLGTFSAPVAMKEILDRAEAAGYKRRKWANPSATLSRATGLAINSPDGWEITGDGRAHLKGLGIELTPLHDVELATGLREYAEIVDEATVRQFVEEAIQCYEYGLHRSSVVMSWLAAIYVLQRWIFRKHLPAFNKELKRVGNKPTIIKSMEDFDKLKESEFLDRISAISLLGKSRKAALKRCLDLRNNCGHPNSLKVSGRSAAAHIEVLLENVFLDKEISLS